MEGFAAGGIEAMHDDATRLRGKLKLPSRGRQFRACAVVGSSGALLHAQYGSRIDAADVIVRFNNAPAGGRFAPMVGSRTDVRVLNSHAASAILQACASFTVDGQCLAANTSCCPLEPVLLNSGREEIVGCFRHACSTRKAVNVKELLRNVSLLTAWARRVRPRSLMSGAYGIAVALLLCTDRVDVYGMSARAAINASRAASTQRPMGPPQLSRYHYYDTCSHFSSDGLDTSAAVLASPRFLTTHSRALSRAAIYIHHATNARGTGATGEHDGDPRPTDLDSQLPPCPERRGIAAVTKLLQRTSRVHSMGATNQSVPSCCTAAQNESGRVARCSWFADRGLCYSWKGFCPVACEVCAVCAGHVARHIYLRLFRRMRYPPLPHFYNVTTARTRSVHGTRAHGAVTRLKELAIFSSRNRSRS